MSEYIGPDLLRSFLEARSTLTQAAAAGQLGIVPAALNAYLKRKQRPRSDIRQRIAKWTDGAVPESSWLTAEETLAVEETDAVVIPSPESPEADERKPTGTES